MKPHTHIHWAYTQAESLEIDHDKLSTAKMKLSRNINHVAREHYSKEVTTLTQAIKDRTVYISEGEKK